LRSILGAIHTMPGKAESLKGLKRRLSRAPSKRKQGKKHNTEGGMAKKRRVLLRGDGGGGSGKKLKVEGFLPIKRKVQRD